MRELKNGDIFLSVNPMALGRAINAFQRFWSKDGASIYSHAGIISDTNGDTLESLWRVERQNLFKAYKGKRVLIARHAEMDLRSFYRAYQIIVEEHLDDFYPFYRLVFHMIPPLAKMSVGNVVCSELVAKFLNILGLFPYVSGCNPDNLHDTFIWGRNWEIVYEGVISV